MLSDFFCVKEKITDFNKHSSIKRKQMLKNKKIEKNESEMKNEAEKRVNLFAFLIN